MSDDNEHINTGRLNEAPISSSADPEEAALDALLLRFGGDYNRPPDFVPREEMWQAIRQQRAPRRFIHQHPAWSVMAAAMLLLGIGIGIGVEARSHTMASRLSAAAVPPAAAVPTTPTPSEKRNDNGERIAPTPTDVASARPAVTGTRSVYASDNNDYEYNGAARSTAYTLATVRHFTAVEALLTSFQTSPHDARGDAQLASYARALLSQTRLLLDSPAASDPTRQRLLQDLELVLVQMTQLSPTDAPIDREMINGSVSRTDVITRLRTAVPAGGTTHL